MSLSEDNESASYRTVASDSPLIASYDAITDHAFVPSLR